MNLFLAELHRLAARRFVQVMLAVLVGAFAITAATTLAGSAQPSDEQVAVARDRATADLAEAVQTYRACLAAQAPGTPGEFRVEVPTTCVAPEPDDYRIEEYLGGVFVFQREIGLLMYLLVAFLALFGFLVGASFIGAELASGGVLNLLLWESRRRRLLGTKLAALLAGVTAVAVVGTVAYVGVFRLIAAVAGWPGPGGAALWGPLALTGLRGVVTALAAAAAGFAIATLGRHTAAALGVVAAYLVAWEAGARVVMTIVDVGLPERYMLSSYLVAWSAGRYDLFDHVACDENYDGCTTAVTAAHGAVVFGVLLAVLLGAAFHRFDRRDLA